jgi:hypothetical protein
MIDVKLVSLEPLAKLPIEAISKPVFCHPERSEGSQPFENTRFFASLRMTYQGKTEVLILSCTQKATLKYSLFLAQAKACGYRYSYFDSILV